MSTKLAIWLCVLYVVVVLTAVGDESEDQKLVENFITDELEKPSITPIRAKFLDKFLYFIHEDGKKGYSTRVGYLANLLRRGLHEAFYSYAHTVIENQEGKTDQMNDDVFAETIQALSEKDFDQAAIKILNGREYSSQHSSHFKAMVASFQKISTGEIDRVISMLKDAHYQLSTDLVDESSLATTKLVATMLGYEFVNNMYRWWYNEISGQRCAKNILESLGPTMGAATGAATGASIGGTFLSFFGGPIGAIMGALGGAVLGKTLGDFFMQQLTQEIFDLPKSEAEEKAYNFFGLNKYASDSEINAAFRKKSQLYHPDNQHTGNHEKFVRINVHMQILRMARGKKKWD